MVDKVHAVPEKWIGKVIGSVDDAALLEVDRALARFLSLDHPQSRTLCRGRV